VKGADMIKISGISKNYKNFQLKDISLEIEKGDYLVILGPSGSGKTVLLEIIATLEKPDSGIIKGVDNSKIGFIYQDLMLFPHLSVFDNIAYGLKMRGVQTEIIKENVFQVSKSLNIEHLSDRSVKTLSGGEKQRVAIARAIIYKPELLLFDEPTASLDHNVKVEIQKLFRQIHRETGATVVHVTHDFNEALSVADKIAVLKNGSIVQFGTPESIFNQPANSFVADFVGYRNVYSGTIEDNYFISGNMKIYLENENCKKVYIALKSEDVVISTEKIESSARNSFEGEVVDIEKKLNGYGVVVKSDFEIHSTVTSASFDNLKLTVGSKVFITFKSSAARVFSH
jgi:molybdate/tungstate transport system ATP-binding protein